MTTFRKAIQRAYGLTAPTVDVFPTPVVTDKPPTTKNFGVPGQIWIDQSLDDVFMLVKQTGSSSASTQTATWFNLAGGSGVFNSLTVGPGTATFNGTSIFDDQVTINDPGGGLDALRITGDVTVTNGRILISFTDDSILLDDDGVSVFNRENDASANLVQFFKNRTGAPVIAGDDLGFIEASGESTTGVSSSSQIFFRADPLGTIGADSVPGFISFRTKEEGAPALPKERMTIDRNGSVDIKAPDAGADALNIAGNTVITAGSLIVSAGNVSGQELNADNDNGGPGGGTSTTFTNNTEGAAGSGSLTIVSATGTGNATNSGFIKIYVGGDTRFIPIFTTVNT